MSDLQKIRDLEQEIFKIRLENQTLDERRKKAELEVLQIQKDSECSVAVLTQECRFAEQRISELSAREHDLLSRLERTRKESEERIAGLENEIRTNEIKRLESEVTHDWESKLKRSRL